MMVGDRVHMTSMATMTAIGACLTDRVEFSRVNSRKSAAVNYSCH